MKIYSSQTGNKHLHLDEMKSYDIKPLELLEQTVKSARKDKAMHSSCCISAAPK